MIDHLKATTTGSFVSLGRCIATATAVVVLHAKEEFYGGKLLETWKIKIKNTGGGGCLTEFMNSRISESATWQTKSEGKHTAASNIIIIIIIINSSSSNRSSNRGSSNLVTQGGNVQHVTTTAESQP